LFTVLSSSIQLKFSNFQRFFSQAWQDAPISITKSEERTLASESLRRPYVYELDPLRVVTAFCVVAVHVLGFTLGLNQDDIGVWIQNAFVTIFHFTRYVFMFVTAFALVYVYADKSFSTKKFWIKRGIAILLPYSIWSIIYTIWNASSLSPLPLLGSTIFNILTGSASFQLYYILLTIQFYILFPLFLFFLKRVAHHPWIVLGISFMLEMAILYFDFYILRLGPLRLTPAGKFIIQYQDRFVLIYQFYFVLGGLTALYLPQIRAFLMRSGQWVIASAIVGLTILLFNYTVQVLIYHQPATAVLQPSIGFFSLIVIVFAYWLAHRWAIATDEQGRPKGYHFWHTLSDASFGLYLIHALTLGMALRWMVPFLPVAWPVVIRVLLTYLVTAGSGILLSIFFMRTPFLSRLVGRVHPSQRKASSPMQAQPTARLEPETSATRRTEVSALRSR
jgi:peptidoglycan/LPS O-acetylase OafA/YrhL